MRYTEAAIASLYYESLAEARRLLSGLVVADGREPTANLGGWVFEQTIRFCLTAELADRGLHPEMADQQKLSGRAKVDLCVGRVAIELKVGGSFGAGDAKYAEYRRVVEQRGWTYLYLTLQESHAPYRIASQGYFGVGHAFFLDTPGEWERFVGAVARLVN